MAELGRISSVLQRAPRAYEGDPSFAAVLHRLVDEASRASVTGTNVAGRDLIIGRDVPAHEER